MSLRFAVVADIHYADRVNRRNPKRAGLHGAALLKRVLRRLEAEGRPDAILLAGDLIDWAGEGDRTAGARLEEFAALLAAIPVPVIAIPGNHDFPPEEFYRHIPRPPEFVEVGGVRIVSFCDPERPGWNAERLPEELAKFDRARAGFSGPLVALQHVPLYPAGTAEEVPYRYWNRDEIIRKMHETGCVLSVSGHHHSGGEAVSDGRCTYTCVPALCETPFSFARISLGDDGAAAYETVSFDRLEE